MTDRLVMAPTPESVEIDPMKWVVVLPDPKVVEKAEIEARLVDWPWTGCPKKLVTIAPYLTNRYQYRTSRGPFQKPQLSQESPLFVTLLSNVVVRRTILDLLFEQHGAAWKFGASCREATLMLEGYVHHWDTVGLVGQGGWFNHCQMPRFGPDAPVQSHLQGSVGPVVVVSPVRGRTGPASYVEQVRNLRTMCVAIYNFAPFFKNLQLHRIGFLSTQHLALFVPHLTKLKVLGVYQCPMLSIAEALRLLEIIQVDRPRGHENQVSLDFYPMYHQGPVSAPGDWTSVGEYGVTWDNWDRDTIKAVWALCTRILPQARKQGSDFESAHTGFRQFMERGPCRKVAEINRAIFDTSLSKAEFAALVDCHNMDHLGNVRRFTNNAAIGNRPEGYLPYVQDHYCLGCKRDVLGIFFAVRDHHTRRVMQSQQHRPGMRCLGCKLTAWLRNERDHYKSYKRDINAQWLHTVSTKVGEDPVTMEDIIQVDWNESDLNKAIRDYDLLDVEALAVDLDRRRRSDMNRADRRENVDHEYNERQVKIDQKRMGRLGSMFRSPLVTSKNDGLSPWSWYRSERARAHGWM